MYGKKEGQQQSEGREEGRQGARQRSRRVLGLVLVLGASSGCLSLEARFLGPPTPLICRDGMPLRILQHPDCTNGICGFTCAPGRWRVTKGADE